MAMKWVLAFILGFCLCLMAEGAVYSPPTLDLTTVQAYFNQITNDDTLILPFGTVQWTGPLTNQWSNSFHIIGAGIGQTIIEDYQTAGGALEPMFSFGVTNTLAPNGNIFREYELTGVSIQGPATWPNNSILVGGAIQIKGTTWGLYIHGISQTNLFDNGIDTYGMVSGDICGNFFQGIGGTHDIEMYSASWVPGLYLTPSAAATQTYFWGEGSWLDPSLLGTSNCMIIESNISVLGTNNIYPTLVPGHAWVDTFDGARWTIRNNTGTNVFISIHGAESTAFNSGGHGGEVYLNTFYQSVNNPNFVTWRSGTGVCWSNTAPFIGSGFMNDCGSGLDYKITDYFPDWGQDYGTNQVCSNIFANGNAAGGPFWSFVAIANCGGITTSQRVIYGSPTNNWTVNQWTNYSVVDANSPTPAIGQGANNTMNYGIIYSNSSSNLYFSASQGYYNKGFLINNGDVLQIWRVTNSYNMAGMGQIAQLLRNSTGQITNTWAGINEAVEPIYNWGNTNITTNGVLHDLVFVPVIGIILNGIHYFNDTPKPGYAPFGASLLTQSPSAPVITVQPQGGTVSLGGSFTFTASASGNPSPTYQWYGPSGQIAGATSDSYSLNNITGGEAGNYYVVANNTQGSAQSQNANLIVGGSTSGPSITSQPQTLIVHQYANASFGVTATGTAPIAYAWYFNGQLIQGFNASVLNLNNIQYNNQGNYWCDLSNAYGTVTSATAGLTAAIGIDASPAGPTAINGTPTSTNVIISVP
jgi:hypothetical protein